MYSSSFIIMYFNCGLFFDNIIEVFPNCFIVLGLSDDKNLL